MNWPWLPRMDRSLSDQFMGSESRRGGYQRSVQAQIPVEVMTEPRWCKPMKFRLHYPRGRRVQRRILIDVVKWQPPPPWSICKWNYMHPKRTRSRRKPGQSTARPD